MHSRLSDQGIILGQILIPKCFDPFLFFLTNKQLKIMTNRHDYLPNKLSRGLRVRQAPQINCIYQSVLLIVGLDFLDAPRDERIVYSSSRI